MAEMAKVLPRSSKRVAADPKLLTTRLAVWLEAQMVERDISQLGLTGKSGVSQAFINGILRRGRIPEDPIVRKLARALQADVNEALAALYLDRVERVLGSAPAETRALFRKIMKE